MTTVREKVRRGVMAAAMIVLAACRADTTTSPPPLSPTSAAALGTATGTIEVGAKTVKAVGWLGALGSDRVATATIGSEGGTLSIPSLGFTLVVPKGAVSAPTKFSVTAMAGKAVAYEFQPHGTVFLKPLKFRQDLRYTNFGWGQTPLGGYFESRLDVDPQNAFAKVKEQLPALVNGTYIEFLISHFSGYLVSCA